MRTSMMDRWVEDFCKRIPKYRGPQAALKYVEYISREVTLEKWEELVRAALDDAQSNNPYVHSSARKWLEKYGLREARENDTSTSTT